MTESAHGAPIDNDAKTTFGAAGDTDELPCPPAAVLFDDRGDATAEGDGDAPSDSDAVGEGELEGVPLLDGDAAEGDGDAPSDSDAVGEGELEGVPLLEIGRAHV